MKSTTVNREEFLHTLESVQPGLSSREIIEQSSCFAFLDGKVVTYNDEIACSHACDVGIVGAVKAEPLLAVLRKLSEDEITITQKNEEGKKGKILSSELLIEGKRRKAGIRCEYEVLLPADKVEAPGKWEPLPEDFADAIALVVNSAGTDQQDFKMTCVHLHPKWVEASDNFQVTRYRMKTGVAEAMLVRASSLKHVPALGMTKFSVSDAWIHFKNPAGLVLSCRRYAETDDYPDMKPVLDCEGSQPITLPKGLGDAADRASVFSAETSDENQVRVELRPGKLRIRGTGATGWFQEVKKVKYQGEPMAFNIDPKLLQEVTKKYSSAEITEGKLKVDGGKWQYVTCLSNPDEKPEAEEAAETEEKSSEE